MIASQNLKVGDELRCPHCGHWHTAATKERHSMQEAGMLYVTCVKGDYYLGIIGGVSRWPVRASDGRTLLSAATRR